MRRTLGGRGAGGRMKTLPRAAIYLCKGAKSARVSAQMALLDEVKVKKVS